MQLLRYRIANARYAYHGRYDRNDDHEEEAENKMKQRANWRERIEKIEYVISYISLRKQTLGGSESALTGPLTIHITSFQAKY